MKRKENEDPKPQPHKRLRGDGVVGFYNPAKLSTMCARVIRNEILKVVGEVDDDDQALEVQDHLIDQLPLPQKVLDDLKYNLF